MDIYENVFRLIGDTPLFELRNYKKKNNLNADIFAKLEFYNAAGSVKDRVAREIIISAEKEGRLKPGATIIEPTSGNTGIALAALAAVRGYKTIIVMPDNMSVERQNLIKSYGAQVVLTDGKKGMRGAIEKADELAASIHGSIIAGQFNNPANPLAHEKTTGPEIWKGMQGKIDIFVACAGTGGTVTGVGRYLKKLNSGIKIIAVEPAGSPMLSKGYAGAHKIQGIGAGFVPETLDTGVLDEVIAVTDEEAFSAVRETAMSEGLTVGISSGAALCAAAQIAKREENYGKKIVTLFPDSGSRYLSTPLFA